MSMMRAGALRHRVILESAVSTADGGGGMTTDWQQIAALWVAIHPLSGDERLAAGQFSSQLSHEIVLRYRPQLLPEMRFRKGERIFEIRAVINVEERGRWLRTFCEELEL